MHFLKNFSKSTVLGITFGILLAFGVAVSAFQSPTQAPPGGNVPAPLHVGPADQTKTGGLLNVFGLWVNQSLGVTGGATFGGNLNLGGNKITNVGNPTVPTDAATKSYADSLGGGHVSGGLYGSCRNNYGRTGWSCHDALSPTFCYSPWGGRSAICDCAAGYKRVTTGTEPWADTEAEYISCYKP